MDEFILPPSIEVQIAYYFIYLFFIYSLIVTKLQQHKQYRRENLNSGYPYKRHHRVSLIQLFDIVLFEK